VKRYLMWLTVGDRGYALNGPSKSLTPKLPWPREADHNIWKTTGLGGGPTGKSGKFTKQEQTIYKEMMAMPMSVSSEEAQKRLGRKYGKSAQEIKRIVDRLLKAEMSQRRESKELQNVTSYAIKLLFEGTAN